MKIAVASSDGTNISPHFGRSPCFLIFNIEEGKFVGKEMRSNTFTAHARGECHGEGGQGHGTQSHASIVEALSDCTAVLCYGMGARAAEALMSQGIQAYVIGKKCTPEDAVALFLAGKLQAANQGFCLPHH
jgi:predicted Fe-Mo cluster-binding NifX family protein